MARPETAPLVLLGEREYEAPYDRIAIDNVAAARDAVRHLIRLGHRRIAFLGSRTGRERRPAHLRLRGWREELAAVCAYNDLIAIGAMRTITERGLRILVQRLSGGPVAEPRRPRPCYRLMIRESTRLSASPEEPHLGM